MLLRGLYAFVGLSFFGCAQVELLQGLCPPGASAPSDQVFNSMLASTVPRRIVSYYFLWIIYFGHLFEKKSPLIKRRMF